MSDNEPNERKPVFLSDRKRTFIMFAGIGGLLVMFAAIALNEAWFG